MRTWIKYLFSAVATIAGSVPCALAQSSNPNPCSFNNTPSVVIEACTRFIDAKQIYTGKPANSLNFSGMFSNRAHAYERLQQYGKAFSAHNESVRRSPNVAFPVSLRGGLFYHLGRYDEALRDFNRTLQIDQRFTDALLNRGAIYLFRGEFTRAEADFAMATRVDPNLASRVQIKRMNMHWFRYLKTLEDENDYQNWSGPPLAAYRAFKGD